ncbi:DUF3100 domain-containing protein [Fusobacterium necrophorum]|uniref:DUF3100 domain-containing protein n=1 Tax=Fusobacterium necrophorum TaxID=859 RepID=A0A4Q2KUH0_9FUSO|nr:DUF3100 domain-containing protein [Fusobacterium necrophorum]RXZ69185.1 DUF3100 domain-containing protein [Fusobacterium necrophorum]
MRNIKLHILALFLVILAEWIGIFKFQLGRGIIALFPMLYALIFGIVAKFVKAANEKDMKDAGSLVGVTLMLLMAKYGTTIGPTLPKIISASPALILQEIGNIGTVLLGVPVAMVLGLHREAIGGAHSIAREPNVAIIADRFGLDSEEGEGVLGVYIVGTVFGTIFMGLLASLLASYTPLHPYSLAMASGVGSASMMTASVGALSTLYSDMAETLTAFGATSNMLSGLDGVYLSIWVSLPLAEWLYKKLQKRGEVK